MYRFPHKIGKTIGIQEWLDMHEEARYAASVTSNEPELIEFNRKYKESIKDGLMKSQK